VFSKYGWIVPLKHGKTALQLRRADYSVN